MPALSGMLLHILVSLFCRPGNEYFTSQCGLWSNQGLTSLYYLIFLVIFTDSHHGPHLILRIAQLQARYGLCPHIAYIPAGKVDK